MNERITLISQFSETDLNYFNNLFKDLNDILCKVPYGKNVNDRYKIDTLPLHFTLSAWNIKNKDLILKKLNNIEFKELNIKLNDIQIMKGKENSYVLYISIEENNELKELQQNIYNELPTEKYNPNTFKFHITIHIDKDYDKIIELQKKLKTKFQKTEIKIKEYGLYEIYPAKLIQTYKNKDDENEETNYRNCR